MQNHAHIKRAELLHSDARLNKEELLEKLYLATIPETPGISELSFDTEEKETLNKLFDEGLVSLEKEKPPEYLRTHKTLCPYPARYALTEKGKESGELKSIKESIKQKVEQLTNIAPEFKFAASFEVKTIEDYSPDVYEWYDGQKVNQYIEFLKKEGKLQNYIEQCNRNGLYFESKERSRKGNTTEWTVYPQIIQLYNSDLRNTDELIAEALGDDPTYTKPSKENIRRIVDEVIKDCGEKIRKELYWRLYKFERLISRAIISHLWNLTHTKSGGASEKDFEIISGAIKEMYIKGKLELIKSLMNEKMGKEALTSPDIKYINDMRNDISHGKIVSHEDAKKFIKKLDEINATIRENTKSILEERQLEGAGTGSEVSLSQ